jgi:hypothetical protein
MTILYSYQNVQGDSSGACAQLDICSGIAEAGAGLVLFNGSSASDQVGVRSAGISSASPNPAKYPLCIVSKTSALVMLPQQRKLSLDEDVRRLVGSGTGAVTGR